MFGMFGALPLCSPNIFMFGHRGTRPSFSLPYVLMKEDFVQQRWGTKYLCSLSYNFVAFAAGVEYRLQIYKLNYSKNKLLLYKAILKPIWTYGVQFWGCSKPSNTKIIQRIQSKILRMVFNAPRYVSNKTLH